MMRRTLGCLIVLGIATGPVFAQKINIDYAHNFDFDKVKTFQYVDTKDSNSSNQLMDGRIRECPRIAGALP